MTMTTIRAARAGLLLAATATAFTLAGCGRSGAATPGAGPGGPGGPAAPVVVTGATVLERSVAPTQEFSGRLEAVEQVSIRARVGGYITAVHVQPGAEVRQGQLLFEIDAAPYQAEADRHQATLMAVRADAELAKLELARASRLLAERAIAQREVDERSASLKKLDAQLRAAQASHTAARLNLGYTRITSPIAGRVSKAEVTRGNLVDPSVILSSVVSNRAVYVSFDGDESTFVRVAPAARRGAPVEVAVGLAGETGFPHKGRLEFVDNRFDRATGSVRMRAVLPDAGPMLVPGLFARVQLGANLAPPGRTLLVAERAIGTDQNRKFVFVIGQDNQASYRAVTLGPVVDGLRVVRTGLKPGETIVIDGVQRVKPGMPLQPRMGAMDGVEGAAVAVVGVGDKTTLAQANRTPAGAPR